MKTDGGSNELILELYDGQMASLSNKRLISDTVPELKFTARGKELFALSESFYCKWLEGGGDYALVEKAIALCREAAALGEPRAVVKMAFYYDKDYLAADRTEEFRCRVACDYYAKVVYCEETPRALDGVSPESWEETQRTAARMFVDMLAGAQKSLSDYTEGKYSCAENARRILAKYGIASERVSLAASQLNDGEKFAETVLISCKRNRSRAPLFGVIKLTAGEVLRVFAQKSEAMKICGDVNIWLDDDSRIVRVNNTSAFRAFSESLQGGGIWLYFVNNNAGGHRYLSGKQRKDLCDLMMKDSFARFIRLKDSLTERGKSRYIFSDDDVQFFINGKLTPVKNALDGLIDRVVCDNEWGKL
ncbi:MAG: hypothetical protein NC033_02465 [Clostridiales bacterium]|nr:hypothetical protein [Clostridiales bacterium]